MFPLLSYLFLLFFFFALPCVPARPTPKFTPESATVAAVKNNSSNTWHEFGRFLDAGRGSHVSGISELKKYFHRFGYLTLHDNSNITDIFDARFEFAVNKYQANLGLPVTGKLDSDTLSQILLPRCGVPDTVQPMHATRHYTYFPGRPRWALRNPMTLTYALSQDHLIRYLSLDDIREVLRRAFARWAAVIPVSFSETDDYRLADIKIGFYSGDHGDGEPFDGVLGLLAYAISPEYGIFHLDAAETWAIDFKLEKSKVAVDLESVAIHEIGHLLGMDHTPVKEAVMYPTFKVGEKRVDLTLDDIQGVQALYGSNPNFSFGDLLESDISSNQAVDFRVRSSKWATFLLVSILCFLYI